MLENSRRIGHAGVEPGAVEVVPQIVMRRDIPPAASPGVTVCPVTQPVHQTPPDRWAQDTRNARAIFFSEFQQGTEIVRCPVAALKPFEEARMSAPNGSDHEMPALDANVGLGAGTVAGKTKGAAARRGHRYRPRADAGKQPAKHFLRPRLSRGKIVTAGCPGDSVAHVDMPFFVPAI